MAVLTIAGAKKGHRQGHIDLAEATVLPLRKARNRGCAGNDPVEPLAAPCNRADHDAEAGLITSRNLRAGGLVQAMVMIPLGAGGSPCAPD